MTRLRVMSDLHLEFGGFDLEPIGEDVLVLAGDVGTFVDGARWAIGYANRHSVPVVMIAGNHEFYRNRAHPGHTLVDTLTALRALDRTELLFNFLENDVRRVAGVRFAGCTLWTGFALGGTDPTVNAAIARSMMSDYHAIVSETKLLQPSDVRLRHERSVEFLRSRAAPHYIGPRPTVVLTHHLPSARSLDARYAGTGLDPCFASDLDGLVEASGAALWVHGHTHASKDYRIGGTRVVCNPRGYHPDGLNSRFDPDLIIEV